MVKINLIVVKLEGVLNTPDDSDIGYFVEIDLKYSDEFKEKTKKIPFAPEKSITPQDKFGKHVKDTKPDKYTSIRRLLCDWIDKRN